MDVRNARRWAPPGPRRWVVSFLALGIAAGLRALLHPLIGPIMPGSAFLIAAALVQYFYGLAPALTVMLLGLGIADYFFVPPYGELTVLDRSDVALLVSYPIITLLNIVLIERLRRAQYRAELIASVAQSRYEMMLRHDNERALVRRATDETHRMLHHVAQHNRSLILIRAIELGPQSGDTAFGKLFAVPGMKTEGLSAGSGTDQGHRAIAIAPGPRHADVHSDDIHRVDSGLPPGRHRIRFKSGQHGWKPVDCVCERFSTHIGDFLVLRMAD